MADTRSTTEARDAGRPIVAVIGDGAIEPGSPREATAHALGRSLVQGGYRVLTGGLGGVMEAACRGASEASGYRFGDTIGVLPGHDSGEANPFVDIALATGLGHARNAIVAHAPAVIAVGGGAGTLAEICFAWIHDRLVLAWRGDGWSARLADARIDERVRFPGVDDRVYGFDEAREAVGLLDRHLREHSGPSS